MSRVSLGNGGFTMALGFGTRFSLFSHSNCQKKSPKESSMDLSFFFFFYTTDSVGKLVLPSR